MSQPGWEDLGWENASYCPLYQVILFDWMACLNNACNHCKLQLEEIMLASGCHDEYVQPRSFSTARITRKGKILPQWSEAEDLKRMVKRKGDHKTPQHPPRHPSNEQRRARFLNHSIPDPANPEHGMNSVSRYHCDTELESGIRISEWQKPPRAFIPQKTQFGSFWEPICREHLQPHNLGRFRTIFAVNTPKSTTWDEKFA